MVCRTCLGPAGAGFARCYQCELALSEAGGLLADVVAPTGYAVRGEPLADDLRRYKSDRADAAAAVGRLGERLAAFLAEQGPSVWEAAGMTARPQVVAVVPSGQGRAGVHPLVNLVRSRVELPLAGLAVAVPEAHARGVNPGWVHVADRMDGGGAPVLDDADVLVVDDTWVSGGSAQSVAAALKLAGARRVAVVVIGRHVNPADPRLAAFLESVRAADSGGGGRWLWRGVPSASAPRRQ